MRKTKIKTFSKDLSFTVAVSSTIGVTAGILVVLIHNFLNKVISDLAFGTGILAIATIILAFFTYWNIRSRSAQEKRDRKERWLNEIIEWATDIKRCGWEVEYTIPSETTKVDIEMFQLQMSANRLSRFMVPSAKNKYVTEIALILGENLCLAVKDTKKQLDNFLPNYRKLFHLVLRK